MLVCSIIYRLVLVAMALAVLWVPLPAAAKGPPSKVTVRGPGWADEIEISDPEVLEAFSFFQFEDINFPVEAPADAGEGYVITRHIIDLDKMVA